MVWWICALIVGSIVCGIFVTQQGVVFKNFDAGIPWHFYFPDEFIVFLEFLGYGIL